jgi:hypothetical protein
MGDRPDITIPEADVAEAWSEFVYPRAAVGDLSEPHPHSGFMRAIRALNTRLPFIVAAELERIAKGRSMIAPEELQDRAAELRGETNG